MRRMQVTELPSRIESVVVHRGGAVVTRTLEAPASSSVRTIRVPGLPLLLDDSTVNISVGGGAVALDLRVALEASSVVPEAPDDSQRLRFAADVTRLENLLVHVDRVRAMVERTSVYRRPQPTDSTPPIEVDVVARLTLLDFRVAEMERLAAERATVARDLEKAQTALRELDDKLRRREGERPVRPDELRKAAIFTLKPTKEGGTAKVSLSYLVMGARWSPAYALHLDKKKNEARLDVRAAIAQSTGEDWTGVRVALSSTAFARPCDLPELSSHRIGRAQPPPKRAYRPPPGDVGTLFSDFERALGPHAAALRPIPKALPEDVLGTDEMTPTRLVAPVAANVAMHSYAPMPGGAGSAPPPPMGGAMTAAPQMSMTPMPPPAMPRSADIPAAAKMPPPQARGMLRSRAPAPAQAQDTFSMVLSESTAAAAAPARIDLQPDDKLLSFGDLRLLPPGTSGGALLPISREQGYVEASATLDIRVAAKVVMALHAASSAMRTFSQKSLPARHVSPSAYLGFDAVYEGAAPIDVPSDGDFHTVSITSARGPSSLSYVVVPRETTDVFRRVEMQSPLDVPLLAGPCDVYVDGAYLLASELEGVAAHGKLSLGLGVDQSIKVARNVWHAEQSAGLMGGSLVLKHQIKVELISHKPDAVTVEVRERVPIAAENEDDVKVEVTEVRPAWSTWEPPPPEPPLKGGYAWRVKLEPKAKLELEANYTVKIPAKLELVGGNRRD
ncbi:MAG: DUF4139 domain-containing protein [Polyangiaceae bacterium]|nr:DUF4139 domain-containing protein [Polyangiaceae bacterium]